MCGHYSDGNLPLGVIGAGLVWLAFFNFEDRESAFRFLLDFFAVVVSLFLARIIFDIVWGGHEAAYEYDESMGAVVGHMLAIAGGVSLFVLTTIAIALTIRRANAIRAKG